MLSQVDSSAILGIDAYIVRVEVDISSSVPMFTIVGLPDAAVQESTGARPQRHQEYGPGVPAAADHHQPRPCRHQEARTGVRSARSPSASWPPPGRCGANGSPRACLSASLRWTAASAPCPASCRWRSRRGRTSGLSWSSPRPTRREAAIVGDVKVYAVRSLADVVVLLNDFDAQTPLTADPTALLHQGGADDLDFCEVKGQEHVKRALEVAAAGGHNILTLCPFSTPSSPRRLRR